MVYKDQFRSLPVASKNPASKAGFFVGYFFPLHFRAIADLMPQMIVRGYSYG